MFVYIEQNYIGEIPRWVVNLVSWNELEGVPTNAEDLSLGTHPTQKNHFQEPTPIALSVINNKGRNWPSKARGQRMLRIPTEGKPNYFWLCSALTKSGNQGSALAQKLVPERRSVSLQGIGEEKHASIFGVGLKRRELGVLLRVHNQATYSIPGPAHFVPAPKHLPIFGHTLARDWLWKFDLSPACFGYGIIIGPNINASTFLGAVLGWGILSPIARHNGWASGPVGDWENGSRGWIL
ncbi:hypothetical protein EDB80DRAFT_676531 [Ilyonectria destructans]|nr:hypothetical protein EDB80DRAFT_676531 [Ilyonectria destructans]